MKKLFLSLTMLALSTSAIAKSSIPAIFEGAWSTGVQHNGYCHMEANGFIIDPSDNTIWNYSDSISYKIKSFLSLTDTEFVAMAQGKNEEEEIVEKSKKLALKLITPQKISINGTVYKACVFPENAG